MLLESWLTFTAIKAKVYVKNDLLLSTHGGHLTSQITHWNFAWFSAHSLSVRYSECFNSKWLRTLWCKYLVYSCFVSYLYEQSNVCRGFITRKRRLQRTKSTPNVERGAKIHVVRLTLRGNSTRHKRGNCMAFTGVIVRTFQRYVVTIFRAEHKVL